MNKKHFDIRHLLDGFVRANSLIYNTHTLAASVSLRTADIWLGPAFEIRTALQRIISESTPSSRELFVSATGCSHDRLLRFEIIAFDMLGKSLSRELRADFEVEQEPGYSRIRFQFSADAISPGHGEFERRHIHVVSNRSTRILECQLKSMGHLVTVSPSTRWSSILGDDTPDLVLIDSSVDSETVCVQGASRFVGLGSDSDLKEKVSSPVLIEDLMTLIPTTAITKILVIDDSLPSRQTTSLMLEGLGYGTTQSATGSAGLEIIKRERHQIVITDINLEDMSGIDLIRRVKVQSSCMRVIAMTGETDEQVHTEIFRAGADQLMIKPIRKKLLERALKHPEVQLLSSEV